MPVDRPLDVESQSNYGYVDDSPLNASDSTGECWYCSVAEGYVAAVDSLIGGATSWARGDLGIRRHEAARTPSLEGTSGRTVGLSMGCSLISER